MGNITNSERVKKQVEGIIKSYNNKIDPSQCKLSKTSKGNWSVENGDGKKICVVSKFVLNDDIATELGYTNPPEPPSESNE